MARLAERYKNEIPGFNSRLDELQAAILIVKLKHLDKLIQKRRNLSQKYNELLKETNMITPVEKEYAKHVYHLYVIRSKDRGKLQELLKSNGINTLIHYPFPIHLQKAYSHLGYKEGDFPVTEKIAKEILSLPMYPELENKELELICKTIQDF